MRVRDMEVKLHVENAWRCLVAIQTDSHMRIHASVGRKLMRKQTHSECSNERKRLFPLSGNRYPGSQPTAS